MDIHRLIEWLRRFASEPTNWVVSITLMLVFYFICISTGVALGEPDASVDMRLHLIYVAYYMGFWWLMLKDGDDSVASNIMYWIEYWFKHI